MCPPQWGAAEAESKVSFGENTELKRSPLKPGVGQYYAYCQGFLLRLFLPFWSVHLHLFSKTSPDFSCVGCC